MGERKYFLPAEARFSEGKEDAHAYRITTN
jgi:hypothetical protein